MFLAARKSAWRHYQENDTETRNRISDAVKKYFGDLQQSFQDTGKMPEEALFRICYLNWHPNENEKFALNAMGFLHKEWSLKYQLTIPNVQDGAEMTPAQQFYAEHAKKIEEMLDATLESQSKYLQENSPAVWAFAENFLQGFKDGNYESVIFRHTPAILEIFMTVPLDYETSKVVYNHSRPGRNDSHLEAGRILVNYVWNYLRKNGFHEENGCREVDVRMRGHGENLYLKMKMELPKEE